jgi:eukaryotic-like serine/threonine-protein kinase
MEVVSTLRYTKQRQIGSGGSGQVHLVDELQLGGVLAIKEIPLARFANTPAEFFAEAKVMFVAEHPNIVPVRYAAQSVTHVCLAMPYYSAGCLAQRIERRALPLFEVIRVGLGLLSGLARVHVNGYVHFDIKPSNVLFDDVEVPRLADFGQARRMQSKGVAVAPTLYDVGAPPEALISGTGTALSDIYQVGLTLYRAANSDLCFNAEVPHESVLEEQIKRGKFPLRKFLPHVPEGLRRVLRRALFVDPNKRFQSVSQFQDSLGRVLPDLNWEATLSPPFGHADIVWRTVGHEPALEVRMVKTGSEWRVEIWGTSAGAKPRRRATKYWKSCSSREDCFKHLQDVFSHQL